MLNSEIFFRALRDKKNKYSNSLNETKNHNRPLQVKWSVPNTPCIHTHMNKIQNKMTKC